MGKMFQRMLSLVLALLTVAALLPGVAVEADAKRNPTYTGVPSITGNGATDMVNMVTSQLGKTGADLGHASGAEWCANFLYTSAEKMNQQMVFGEYVSGAGALLTSIKNDGGTVIYDRDKGTGALKNAKPGDVVGYRWKGKSGISHVELVTAVSGSKITTIGGNVGSSDGTKSKVAQRTTTGGQIAMIVRPAYHNFGSRGQCTVDGCGLVFDWQSTRVEMTGTITTGTGKLWPMDVPYSAGAGGINLKDGAGNKITLTGSVTFIAKVTNVYKNTWYEVKLEDGRIGYVYPDGEAAVSGKILWVSKLITPAKRYTPKAKALPPM